MASHAETTLVQSRLRMHELTDIESTIAQMVATQWPDGTFSTKQFTSENFIRPREYLVFKMKVENSDLQSPINVTFYIYPDQENEQATLHVIRLSNKESVQRRSDYRLRTCIDASINVSIYEDSIAYIANHFEKRIISKFKTGMRQQKTDAIRGNAKAQKQQEKRRNLKSEILAEHGLPDNAKTSYAFDLVLKISAPAETKKAFAKLLPLLT